MIRARIAGSAVALAVLGASLAVAQPSKQSSKQNEPSSMAKGLTANSGQPVRIESTSLEVRDKSRMATFTGNVKVTQGDSTVQCKVLVVFYEDNTAPAPANGKAGPAIASPGGGKQQIKRMEAKGDVIITQKDQTASGDNGLFDVKANTLTLTGNVVLTQNQNVLRGERMVVEMTTGVTRVYAGKEPVSGIMFPGQNETKNGPQAQPYAPVPPPAAKSKSTVPMRIN